MRQRTSFPLLFVPTLARKKKREKNGGRNSLKKAFCSAFPLVVPCFVQKRKPMTSPLAVAHRSRKQSEGGARPFFFAPFCAFVNQQREEPKKTKRERGREFSSKHAHFRFFDFPFSARRRAKRGGGERFFPPKWLLRLPSAGRSAAAAGLRRSSLAPGRRERR